jgi:hypothetical protein
MFARNKSVADIEAIAAHFVGFFCIDNSNYRLFRNQYVTCKKINLHF